MYNHELVLNNLFKEKFMPLVIEFYGDNKRSKGHLVIDRNAWSRRVAKSEDIVGFLARNMFENTINRYILNSLKECGFMRKRTQSREYALKILYQAELTRREIHLAAEKFWSEFESIDEHVRSFSDRLTTGVEENCQKIDNHGWE